MLSTIDLPCLPQASLRRLSAACSQNLHHRSTKGAFPGLPDPAGSWRARTVHRVFLSDPSHEGYPDRG